ncbi:MAG: hypothetical protein WC686_00240 [Candidatus Shapirobacteria bacterium]|jgi:hypothetical protein
MKTLWHLGRKAYISVSGLLLLLLSLSQPAFSVTHDIADSNNWNLKITKVTGEIDKYNFADVNNNGINDLLLCNEYINNHNGTYSGSCYVIYDSILSRFQGIGQTLDITNSQNYSLRFDGPMAQTKLGYSSGTTVGDFNGNGKADLLIPASYAFILNWGSGSFYVIMDDILDDFVGVGNTIDLADPNSFSIRYDGHTSGSVKNYASEATLLAADVNNNGIDDIISGSGHSGLVGRDRSGSLYVIYDGLIRSKSGRGNLVDLWQGENAYNIVFYNAANTYFSLYNSTLVKDFDHNGKNDILVGAGYADNRSLTNSGSLYFISDDIIDNYSETNHQVDLSNINNFSWRLDGAAAGDMLSYASIAAGDLNNNGLNDLAISSSGADNRSRSGSGSYYILFDSFFSSLVGVGKTLNLANGNFSIRYDGASPDSALGYSSKDVFDFNNDGFNDLVIPSYGDSNNSRPYSGSTYLIYNTKFTGLTGLNNTIDISDPEKYDIRFDGDVADGYYSFQNNFGDLNGDGSTDLLSFSPGDWDQNGYMYLIYNFPHTITSNNSSSSIGTTLITGSVVATQSVTAISGVQYQIGSSNPASGWSDCVAADGAFGEKSEDYSCYLAGLTNGSSHIVYFRAYDANTSYTSSSRYSSVSFTYDVSPPSLDTPSVTVFGTGATLAWVTTEESSSQINYGLTSLLGSSTPQADTSPLVTSHTVELTSLVPCTLYYFQAISTDLALNQSAGNSGTFITSGCPGNSEISLTASQIVPVSTGATSTLSSIGSTLALSLPSSYSAADATIQLKQLDHQSVIAALNTPSLDYLQSSLVFDLKALSSTGSTVSSFIQPLTLTLLYSYSQIPNLDEGTLMFYYHDGSSWNPLVDSVVNKESRTLTATTTHFSTFMVFGKSSSGMITSPASPSSSSSQAPVCGDPPPSSTPDLFQIDTTSTTAKLFFTPISNTSEFFISFSSSPTAEEHGEKVTLLREGVQSHTLFSLKPSTIYYFKVRGQSGCTPGGWSKILKAKTGSSKAVITKYYPNSLIPQSPPASISKSKSKTLTTQATPSVFNDLAPSFQPTSVPQHPAPTLPAPTSTPSPGFWPQLKSILGL